MGRVRQTATTLDSRATGCSGGPVKRWQYVHNSSSGLGGLLKMDTAFVTCGVHPGRRYSVVHNITVFRIPRPLYFCLVVGLLRGVRVCGTVECLTQLNIDDSDKLYFLRGGRGARNNMPHTPESRRFGWAPHADDGNIL